MYLGLISMKGQTIKVQRNPAAHILVVIESLASRLCKNYLKYLSRNYRDWISITFNRSLSTLLFPTKLSVKRTHNSSLLFYLNDWIIVTTVLTAHETGICTFLPNSQILIIVSWIIDLWIHCIKRTLLNEQYFGENKKGMHLFCLWKIA